MENLNNAEIQAMLSSEEYGQAHLFDGEPSEALFEQLKHFNRTLPGGIINYINNSKRLFANSATGQSPFEGWQPQIPEGFTVDLENTNEVIDYEASGIPELGKCCFVMVAGGLGERLGYSSIKIGLPVELVTGTSFVEYYAKHILEYERRSGEEIPFAIMTSGDTHDLTVSLLEEKSNFGLPDITLMKQELVPAMIDSNARFSMKDGLVEAKPHGHGDVMSLVYQHGLVKKWKDAGKKWVIFLQDTNAVWFKVLPAFLGVSAKNNLLFNFLTFPRVAKEQAGCIVTMTKDDQKRTQSVEYNQIDALLKGAGQSEGDTATPGTNISPYPGNINTLLISLPEFADVLEQTGGGMPEFVNPKYADETKTLFKSPARLECMMQDYPLLLNDFSKVSFTQIDRQFSFAATKNSIEGAKAAVAAGLPPSSAGSNEVDFYACNARLLDLGGASFTGEPDTQTFAGLDYTVWPKVVINPSFAIGMTDILSKVNSGWEISFNSTLVLSCLNPVTKLKLDGAAHLTQNASEATVESAQFPTFVDSEEGDPDHIQIRGFKLINADQIQEIN